MAAAIEDGAFMPVSLVGGLKALPRLDCAALTSVTQSWQAL